MLFSNANFAQGQHKKRAKPNYIASVSYGQTYRDVLAPSSNYSQDLFKYTNRTASKTYLSAAFAVRQPVYNSMNLLIGIEYSSVRENISEGFIHLLPESMNKNEVFNSLLSAYSGSIQIGETILKKKKKVQLAIGPVFTLHSMYEGNTLSDEWTIIAIDKKPETNFITAWDVSASIDFEIANEVDLSLGLQGRLGSQMMSLEDGLYRNYNAVLGKLGFVYYPGRYDSTIHTIEREEKPSDELLLIEIK